MQVHQMRAYHRLERFTEVPMLVLAIVYLLLEIFPQVISVSTEVLRLVEGVEWFIWALFALELISKFYLYPNKLRFLTTHWADVLIVTMPFLRPLRLLKILVILYRTWKRSRRLFRQRALNFVGLMSVLVVAISAGLVLVFEKGQGGTINSYQDALWWAVTTITTVGYGDKFPVTPAGRGVAIFLMFTGITLFGLLTATVAAFFVDDEKEPQDQEVHDRLVRLEAHVLELKALLKEKQGREDSL
ncbi:potassium channel family protein [Deinococcus cellulosilyticus]|uniref:Potassium channel protein n=1 Tax=Deinococcus cellulosilyticus (strain DSM 18568 / NBRC 106333 / KACC 11606 / 5516J-15) TaxID=1223518 RepID=A0A511NAK0_DEIC1|nr:potassium channel family protein [Deinococcus cellulosilyticus]GEM49855.1 potassium channel protein [Deinococcus cellulosilyticus NBRC 106333 = KACC 11606]